MESRKPPSICTSPCVCRGRRCQIHTPDIAPNLVSEGGYVGSTVVCNHGEAGGQRVMPRQRLYLKGSSPVRGVRTTGYTGTADSCSHVSASNQAKLSSLASPSQTPLAGSTLDLRWAICRLPFPRSHPARQSAMREEIRRFFIESKIRRPPRFTVQLIAACQRLSPLLTLPNLPIRLGPRLNPHPRPHPHIPVDERLERTSVVKSTNHACRGTPGVGLGTIDTLCLVDMP